MDNKGDAYQVLSNLLHKGNGKDRGVDTRESKDSGGNYPEMEITQFDNGCAEISKHLPGFSYSNLLNRITDTNAMKALYGTCTNGYEKLQVFRLLGFDVEISVIQKFINETYHIENEFICQLNPAKFDTIPEYVVSECNRMLQGAK